MSRKIYRNGFVMVLLACLAAAGCQSPPGESSGSGKKESTQAQAPVEVQFPPDDIGVATLKERADKQMRTKPLFKAFNDFSFEDKIEESGIGFKHRIVEDAGITYKAVHYDHGNGVAVADVDGDGMYDIYFSSQLGGGALYRNLGGRFEDITQSAGISLPDRIGVTGSFADVDNDGDEDLYVTTVNTGNALFINDGKGHFKDATADSGLTHVGHSSGAVFFDYDRDGWLDLFLVNVGNYTINKKHASGAWVGREDAFHGHLFPERTERSILYRNTGNGHFVDVSSETGLNDAGWSGDGSFADLNKDGWPDVYVLNMQGDDHYYENDKGHFTDKTAEHFPKTPWGSMGIKFFDYDNDGLEDLFLTDMHSDMSEEIGPDREKLKSRIQWDEKYLGKTSSIFGNAFYHNLGNGKFEEISDRIGAENYWPWGFTVGDLNADGFQDVFIASSMCYPFRYGINTLLLNNEGERFLDSEFILGIEPRRGGRTHAPWFEVDCGDPEQKDRFACKGRSAGRVTVLGPLGTRSSVFFDLDGDGDLDIVTNEFNAAPQVLISNLSEKTSIKYLLVDLKGTKSNRDGLGAEVRVHAGGHTYVQWQDGKSGYLSQSAMPLYFGLGDAGAVEKIEVIWPSGTKQTVTSGIPVNDRFEIVETR